MIAFPPGVKVWIAGGVTDMRRGMNTLALQVQQGLGRDLHAGEIFCCRGRRCDLVKLLWHGRGRRAIVRHWFENNGERNAGGHSAAVEGDPDRPREVHMPAVREDQPTAGPLSPDAARLGRAQPAGARHWA